jgi:hypothetical protein
MLGQRVGGDPGDRDGAMPGPGLRWPEVRMAADVDQRLANCDSASQRADPYLRTNHNVCLHSQAGTYLHAAVGYESVKVGYRASAAEGCSGHCSSELFHCWACIGSSVILASDTQGYESSQLSCPRFRLVVRADA